MGKYWPLLVEIVYILVPAVQPYTHLHMNGTRLCLLSILLLLSGSLSGQTDSSSDKASEIGLMPIRWEWNSHGFYPFKSVKMTPGIYYNRMIPNTTLVWTTSLLYGSNNIFAACSDCEGISIKTGLLTEISIASGIGYTMFQDKPFFLKPYVQAEAHYTHENFSGLFENFGFVPGTPPFNMSYQTFGTIAKAGIKASIRDKITLTCMSSFRFGMGIQEGQARMALRFASSPIEIRCGWRF